MLPKFRQLTGVLPSLWESVVFCHVIGVAPSHMDVTLRNRGRHFAPGTGSREQSDQSKFRSFKRARLTMSSRHGIANGQLFNCLPSTEVVKLLNEVYEVQKLLNFLNDVALGVHSTEFDFAKNLT